MCSDVLEKELTWNIDQGYWEKCQIRAAAHDGNADPSGSTEKGSNSPKPEKHIKK